MNHIIVIIIISSSSIIYSFIIEAAKEVPQS